MKKILSAGEQTKAEPQAKPIQRKGEGGEAGSSLESKLNASKSGGSPLPTDTQEYMGSRFGTDFSGVKVHTDSSAVQMNKELNSQAFAHGSHVYFNQGKYDPGSGSGKHLLAHELTHTVQQGKNLNMKQVQRNICTTNINDTVWWYKSGNGRKKYNHSFSPEWVDELAKVAGLNYEDLARKVKVSKKIDKNFVKLVCIVQQRLGVESDGRVGDLTIKAWKQGRSLVQIRRIKR